MASSRKQKPKPPRLPRGLKRRTNASGSVRWYWTCNKLATQLGYRPPIVPLHETEEGALVEACRILEGEMLEWIARKQGSSHPVEREWTVAMLFREYRLRDSSPFQRIKWNTRRTYSQALDALEEAVGSIYLKHINIDVLWRWYEDARWPEGKGNGQDHIRKAHGFMSMLRKAVSFGVRAEIPECTRLCAILGEERFPAPKARKQRMSLAHAEAFIATALQEGRRSLALGTALQFECGMRQRDVIGEWNPIQGEATSPYVLARRQWENGLLWTDMVGNVLTKRTTKTGAVVRHDLSLCPMASAIIATIPTEARAFGPVIVDEKVGRPYAEHAYQREWRAIARQAGVPDDVWNMDARSGAASEADEAGAAPEDIQRLLGHSDVKTTMRYIRSEGLGRTRRVAEARVKARQEEK